MASLRWVAAVCAAVTLAACASSNKPSKPAFPTDVLPVDDCHAYCLVWVPPQCREVPHLVCCKKPTKCETVFRKEIGFEECCKPGCYEKRCCPCKCETEEVVEVTPRRTEWERVACRGPYDDCYRPVEIPPTYRWCPKTVTEAGVEYCAFKPPVYDVVEKDRLLCVQREVYVPAEWKVVWEREEFAPGHWEWQCTKCDCAPPPCPPPPKCAPCSCACPVTPACGCGAPAPSCGCGAPAPMPVRGDFAVAPAKD